MTVSEAAKLLKQAEDILIISHKRPDGDTVGSAAALCLALKSIGKRAFVFYDKGITERYSPFLKGLYAPHDYAPACIVAVDIADFTLFPEAAECFKSRVDLAVDHHPTNTNYAKHNLVDPSAAAAGEIIYDI
jgi:phosphoesterase RecJ-like protein